MWSILEEKKEESPTGGEPGIRWRLSCLGELVFSRTVCFAWSRLVMEFNRVPPSYYSVLGVDPDASGEEIRRAYHKLAMVSSSTVILLFPLSVSCKCLLNCVCVFSKGCFLVVFWNVEAVINYWIWFSNGIQISCLETPLFLERRNRGFSKFKKRIQVCELYIFTKQ